jgi:hypothetical protein
MTINELIPIIILLFAAFICIYAITTRICDCFEYETKVNAVKNIVKAYTEKGTIYDIDALVNSLEAKNIKEK